MKLAALFIVLFPLLPARTEARAQAAKPEVKQEAKPQVSPLAAERKELAALRLLVVADRKFAEAKERLVQLERSLQDSSADGAAALRRDVRALLDEVRRALGESIASGRDRIDDAARRAIAEGDYAFLQQIGAAAVPALREAVRATPDFLPSEFGGDPFYYLLKADPLAASELCDELAGEQGFFWKRRVLRALAALGGFEFDPLWSGGYPGSLAVPGLVRQYELVLADPSMAVDAYRWLEPILKRDALTPTLRASLLAALASEDVGLRSAAWSVAAAKLSLRSVYWELLRSSDAEVRGQAAYSLSLREEETPEFLALASDPDAGVRWAVADLLGRGMELGSPEAMTALDLLLVDGDENVRKIARRVLESNRLPTRMHEFSREPSVKRELYEVAPSQETIARLATSGDVETRRLLAERVLERVDAKIAMPLLARLAADADEKTASEAFATVRAFWFEDAEGCLRVADAALANLAIERSRVLQVAGNVVSRLVWWEPTRALGMRWAFAQEEAWLVQAARLENVETMSLSGLPAELLDEYCRRLFVADRPHVTSLCESKTLRFELAQLEALVVLAADAREPAGLRLLAALPPLRAGKMGPELATALRALCADDWWKNEPGPKWGSALADALDRMPGELVNECLLALARAPAVPASVLSFPLTRIELSAPGARELLRFLLESRFGVEEAEQRQFASQALVYMGRAPALAEREWLERGARHPDHQSAALTALGTLRDPSYLPLLDELIRSGDTMTVGRVAEALSGYLSHEAGELLLVAATRLSGEKRDEALAHLAKIREYQAARAEWATRTVASATRAEVVAELVAKLDAKSEEIKVQAIRALATWEAVEAMPRLIELTQSGSKSVAAAARAALERMNAPEEVAGPH